MLLGTTTTTAPPLTLPSKAFLPSRRRQMSVHSAVVAPSAVAPSDRKSLYEVLRVNRNASQVEIKTAYRTLAKLYHPDATSRFMDSSVASSSSDRDGDGVNFIEIHRAYATLSDPESRAVYDFNLSDVGNTDPQRGTRWGGVTAADPGRARFTRTRRWETDQCW